MTATTVLSFPARRLVLLTALAAMIGLTVLVTATSAAHSATQTASKPTIVLVHGAWADASSWNGVIERLQREGYTVLAPANPLRGIPSDAAYIGSVLAGVSGPIVLVGHSYGGAVITNAAAGNANVKALVYIAAYIPDAGETLGALTGQFPGSQLDPASSLTVLEYPTSDGSVGHDAYVKPELFRQLFAADLPATTTALMAATQRPIEAASLVIPSAAAAWKTISAFCLIATADTTIGTANTRFMAHRACADTVEVDASHAVLVSQPAAVADLIITAAQVAQ